MLYRWATEGVPLGISRPIEHTGIFPKSDDVSAAIKASQTLGVLAEDWSGEATNYKSFQEAGDKAFAELDRLVEEDRADLVNSWEEVVQLVGPKAKLTQMACIVKIKEGVEKVRLVVDMRRSGVNGLMKLYERVCLPRIYDVARSVDELFKLSHDNDVLVFMVADFSDAFYTLRLHADERPWVVVKGRPNQYYCLKCISFGLACGPLVWARFASMCMRLSQAACLNHEARHQCYVDDPVVIASGSCHRDRSRVFFRVTLLWQVLGFKVAWHKAFRGSSVSWIGVKLSFQGSSHRDLRVELPEEKVSKILASFKEIRSHNGVFPTKLLESTVGLFSWASSIIPLARPWTAGLWSALHAAKRADGSAPAKETTRVRKGLVFRKQVDHCLAWLEAMLTCKGSFLDGSPVQPLVKIFHWSRDDPLVGITTDACPFGLGGILHVGGTAVAYFSHKLRESDKEALGPTVVLGDPSFQSEWELLSIFVAIRLFSRFLHNRRIRFFVKTDNTSALTGALEYSSKSPIMSQLCAEIALCLESSGLQPALGRHVRGICNEEADDLSRLKIPSSVAHATRLTVPELQSLFRAWPRQ